MIRVQVRGLAKFKRKVQKDLKALRKAASRTVNDAAKNTKTFMAKEAASIYTLPSKRIKKGISVKPSRRSEKEPVAVVTFSRKPPGLQHFKPKETRGNVSYGITKGGLTGRRRKRRGRTQGLTVEVKRGQRKHVKGAFLAYTSGAPGVFKRKGKARLPIERLHGPSVGGMLRAGIGMKTVLKFIKERKGKLWRRHLRFYMKG